MSTRKKELILIITLLSLVLSTCTSTPRNVPVAVDCPPKPKVPASLIAPPIEQNFLSRMQKTFGMTTQPLSN